MAAWSEEQRAQLREMVGSGAQSGEIASALGRTCKSVNRQIARLFPGGTGRPRGPRAVPFPKRFWASVDVRAPDDCHTWTGTINHLRGGYGYLPVKHDDGTWQLRRAHRVAWEIAHGQSVPDGMDVLHTCENPPRVNARHLILRAS